MSNNFFKALKWIKIQVEVQISNNVVFECGSANINAGITTTTEYDHLDKLHRPVVYTPVSYQLPNFQVYIPAAPITNSPSASFSELSPAPATPPTPVLALPSLTSPGGETSDLPVTPCRTPHILEACVVPAVSSDAHSLADVGGCFLQRKSIIPALPLLIDAIDADTEKSSEPTTSSAEDAEIETTESQIQSSDMSTSADLEEAVIVQVPPTTCIVRQPVAIDVISISSVNSELTADSQALSSYDTDKSDFEEADIVYVHTIKTPIKFTQCRSEWWSLSCAEIGQSAQDLWGLPLTTDTRVMRKLGQGGFGAVYLVSFLECGEWVERAVKVMENKPSCLRTFKSEISTSLTLSGLEDRVALVRSSYETPQALFTTYDFYSLGSLSDASLTTAQLVSIFAELCTTLAACHALGIVHADVKPDNILLTRRGDTIFPILADLGLCQDLTNGRPIGRVGTPVYMAPEVWTSKDSKVGWGTEVDVYALGVALHRLFAGHGWYKLYSDWEAQLGQGFEERWWSETETDDRFGSSLIRDLVAACCNENPDERPTTQELADDLQAIIGYVKRGGSLSDPADLVYAWLEEQA